MQSIILSSKNKKLIEDYLNKLHKDLKISPFDIDIAENEKSIGIEEIRNLQKKIFLKPAQGNLKTLIIKSSENLTKEAQNALLKVLEEPPASIVIILTTISKDLLLPTIVSRCKIIELEDSRAKHPKNEISQYPDLLMSLFRGDGAGSRLKLAEKMGKTKEDALEAIEKMILAAREQLVDNALNPGQKEKNLISQYLNTLISLNKTYIVIKTTNVNPRFTLENLFLNI